jgi:Uma2 family endonuclease
MPIRSQRKKHAKRSGSVTFDEFCQIIREDQKADLMDGVIYMPSPENTDSNELFLWLATLLHDIVQMLDLGKVYGSRVAFRLGEKNAPEPDIAFIRTNQLHRVHRGFIEGPADLAMEIVSPESVERDYEKKLQLYEKHGFLEYWIIDEELEQITVYYLDGRGKYRQIRLRKGELHSRALPGFWLKPKWLWQSPRPLKTDVLNEILGRAK